jgi:O-antigen ligase
MDAGLPRGSRESAGPVLLGVSAVLLAVALFASNGSAYGPVVFVGGLAVLVVGAAVSLAGLGVLAWPRLDRFALASVLLLAAFVCWTGLSVLWSIVPDQSWQYLNRSLVYVAFLVLGLFVGVSLPQAARRTAAVLTVLLAAVILWALAGKVLPALFPDGARIARLRDPIGYWNGLALLCAMALPLSVWSAIRREHPRLVRTAGVVLAFLTTVALLLTYSRGGAVVALVAVGIYVAFCGRRLEALAALAIAVPPALVVSAWAFSRPGLVDDGQSYDNRLHDGLILGAALVVLGAGVAAAAWVAIAREDRWRARFRWQPSGTRLAVGAVAALAVVVLLVSGGHPVDWLRDGFNEFTNPTSTAGSSPERITSLSSNSRWTWWKEAWRLWEDNPVVGTGAASFAVARRPIRENTTYATEPHNLALQFLAETGLVGLLLAAGAWVTGGVALVRALRRFEGAEHSAALALAVAAVAYLLHALVDYDWDFLALTAPLMLILGVLLGAAAPGVRRARSLVWSVAGIAVALVVVSSLAAPWLASRKVDDAFAALRESQPERALDDAKTAKSLNPLSLEPLLAQAAAEEAQGDQVAALRAYQDAVRLQPENPRGWFELGQFELNAGLRERGIEDLERSRELDPLGPANDLLIQLGL